MCLKADTEDEKLNLTQVLQNIFRKLRYKEITISKEGDSMGLDNVNNHSLSAVVSIIDDFFTHNSNGEQNCFTNCDHCGGQNKNQTVIDYFCCRTILGYNKPYHARYQIDVMFEIVRQKLEYTQSQAMVGFGEIGKKYLSNYFKPISNVRKYFHFIFSALDPWYVVVKESVESAEKRVCILKNGKSVNRDLPSRLESAGLSATRQWNLYRNIKSIPPKL
ncbi:hypothetical protein KUTeg_011510 [Tegillarca granosa]|uniref:Uncharacterized protein n=1 Tax=Tegillarca granosa TaxID=220873 RepID=A0ABQ9F0N0_TEGGR|nr:hypothetical protein KUTeg_011510 [Tegillarca granosa]